MSVKSVFTISMVEVAMVDGIHCLQRQTRSFDSAEALAEHYEHQKLLRGQQPEWVFSNRANFPQACPAALLIA